MTNKDLKAFRNAIHTSLKIAPRGSCFVVKEENKCSVIKKIEFTFKNQDDVVIIKQESNHPTKQLFQQERSEKSTESCDFIVLIHKITTEIYFCEIKSRFTPDNCKKAIKQIKSSKIFFEYLYRSYKECFNSNFEISLKNAKHILIYPSSAEEKHTTSYSEGNLKLEPRLIEIKDFEAKIADGYKFFERS